MDPVTLVLIGAGGAAAASLAASIGPIWRRVKLRRARDLVTRPIIGAQVGSDAPRTVYDVFCDLGSSEYAVEVMRHMDLLPEKEEDLELSASNLTDSISAFGGYDPMVTSLKETIEEMSQESDKDAAEILKSRLTLVAPRQTDALLPAVERPDGVDPAALPEGEEIKQLEAQTSSSRQSSPPADPVPLLHATVDDALAELFGANRNPHAGILDEGTGGLAAIVIGGVLGSLTTGGFWDGVSRFVQRRRVKQMRSQLSQELAGLSLDVFHSAQQVHQQIEQNLSLLIQERRWVVERRRRELARHQKLPRKQRSTVQMALKTLASDDARVALIGAERDIKKLTNQITRHRRSGRHDLAGFLIYVNRQDMLRGLDVFNTRILAIEEAGEQLRQALLAEVPPPGSDQSNTPQGSGQLDGGPSDNFMV